MDFDVENISGCLLVGLIIIVIVVLVACLIVAGFLAWQVFA